MKYRGLFSASCAVLAVSGLAAVASLPAHAQLVEAGVTGSGPYNKSETLIIDDVFPAEGSAFNSSLTVDWSGTATFFTIDYGSVFTIQDLLVSVDNNDTYLFQYSVDGIAFSPLVTLPSSAGEIGGGMDTISSVLGDPEYDAAFDFASVDARYIRVSAVSGDNLYAIGEIQAFGVSPSAAAPEPGTLALLGAGGLALAGIVTRKRRR